MMKFSPLLLCLIPALGFPKLAQAQFYCERPEFIKANSHWMISNSTVNGQGINLNTNPPGLVSFTGFYGESGAVISDTANGEMLFYSNGEKCWNKNYQLMPNGDSLAGGESANQSAIIVPVFDSPGKFYLFTLKAHDFGPQFDSSLHYSIVDMSREGGLGDIDPLQKNILLDADPLQEAMIAIPGNNCDVWLLVHPHHDTLFRAYHITREGVNPTPVVSSPGGMINGSMLAFDDGNMAVSPDRTKLCVTSFSYSCMMMGFMPNHGGVMIADFDPNSGMVSNGIVLNDSMAGYAACFSPDNSKLYVQGLVPNEDGAWNDTAGSTEILQYDLSTYTPAAMLASEYKVYTYPQGSRFFGLRRRNDTIVVSGDLPYIASPDLAGPACNFQAGPYISGAGTTGSVNLGTESVYPLPPDTLNRLALDTLLCDAMVLEAPAEAITFHWDDNSTAATREISAAGTYWLAYQTACHFIVDTYVVDIIGLNPVITVNQHTLRTSRPYSSYQWLRNDSLIPGATDSTYTVLENGSYRVIVADENGCTDTSESYLVTSLDVPAANHGADRIHIYPNPGGSLLYIDAPHSVEFDLFTIDGRLIRSEVYEKPVNIRALPGGLYLLQIKDRTGKLIKIEKLVKTP